VLPISKRSAIQGTHYGAAEEWSPLGCDAVSLGMQFKINYNFLESLTMNIKHYNPSNYQQLHNQQYRITSHTIWNLIEMLYGNFVDAPSVNKNK
jgi:hypothetical protein